MEYTTLLKADLMLLGIPAVRIMSVSFFLSSVGIIFASVFQGFGNGTYSMYLAFMRQVILLIPILFIGSFMGNLVVIWSGFAIAELLSIPFGMLLYRKMKKNMINLNERGDNVTEYRENMEAVVQNLEDAGCDKDTVDQFLELGKTGKKQGQVNLLEKHRRTLLEKVHRCEKQIDCLDYFLYQIRKEI